MQGVRSPYHSWLMPWGAYVAIAGFAFLALINGFNVFWPQNWTPASFLTSYIGLPIFLAIYFGHRIYTWSDPWAHAPEDVDLVTGMEQVLADEKPPKGTQTGWKSWVTALWK